jgi:hypothetical protein
MYFVVSRADVTGLPLHTDNTVILFAKLGVALLCGRLICYMIKDKIDGKNKTFNCM